MKVRTLVLGLLVGIGVAGCGSKEGASGASGQGTAAPGAKPGATSAGGPAGAVDPACTAFVDRTDEGADRVIDWKPGIGAAAERCMKVKVGQDVVFEGDFTKHPMKTAKGDVPSPIAPVQASVSNPGVAGEERSIGHFTWAGTFGFVSEKDPTMKGAIQVVP